MAEGIKVRAPLALGRINVASKMRTYCVFPVLAFFALMSSDCVSAVFTALPQESPVVVAVGDTAILRCHTSVPKELTEARWIRIQGGRYSIINIFKDGWDQQRCDLPEYIGRTEVMRDGLAHGRAALKLFNVSVADEGTYRCFLGTVDFFDFVNLEIRVTALGSDTKIDIEGFQDGGIKAVCRSAGWYPEPTLVNKDDDGEMKIQKEENGLYSIEYSRVITKNSKLTFSCMFRTLFPKQEWETSVYVADGLFRKSTDVIILIVFVCSLAAVVIICIFNTCLKNGQGVSKFGCLCCLRSNPSKKHSTLKQLSFYCPGVSRFGCLCCLRSNPSKKHSTHEQLPASLSCPDLEVQSDTKKEVNPKEEKPIDCESSTVEQAQLLRCLDSEGDMEKFQSVNSKEVNPKEEKPIGCESSPVTQALPALAPDSEANIENSPLNVA